MRVSAKAEYACIAMLELAANFESVQPVRVKAIADAHGIPQRFLVQILLQLKGVGLVASVRGALGGYQLAKPPHQISLGDIIHAIDPPDSSRSAPVGSSSSPVVQTLHAVWQEIQTQEQRLLEETTLDGLVQRSQSAHFPFYQI